MVTWPLAFTRHTRGQRIQEADVNDLQEALEALGAITAEGRSVRSELGITRKNLRSEGFALDGSDESTAMNAMIAADSPGVIYVVPDGATLGMGSTQLLINTKPHTRIEGYEGATIQWTGVPLSGGVGTALILVLASPNFGIDNIVVDGAETSFIDANSSRYAVSFDDSPHARLSRLTLSGTSRGISVRDSDEAILDDIDYTGFLTSEAGIANANYHTACMVFNSDDVRISRITGRNCGSVVVPAETSARGVISEMLGHNIFDNGIYLSGAGDGWSIDQVAVYNDTRAAGNTGMKILGSQHRVTNVHVENMGGGIVLGGYDTDQGDGYTGYGTSLIGATIRNIDGSGLQITTNGGGSFGPRDFIAAFVDMEGCAASAGANSSFFTDRAHHCQLLFNTVTNHLGTSAAYQFAGVSGTPLVGNQMIGNKARKVAGGVNAFGVYANWADQMIIDGTLLHDITAASMGIRIENATTCRVHRTRPMGTVGTSNTIRVQSGTNNIVTNNPGCTISDSGTGTIKPQTYTVTNHTTDRALNETADTLAQGLNVLGTLIADLRDQGWVL